MTLPTALREFLRRRYAECFYRGGMRKFHRSLGSATPEVCIEDAMLRIHCVSYEHMRSYARMRHAKMRELGCLDDEAVVRALREQDGIDVDSAEPLWFDVFLWLMVSVQRFYDTHANCAVYVMLFDRGTPPAKYLKHIERYANRARRIPPQHVLASAADADAVFTSSPAIPPHAKHYFAQKGFVDALIRYVACVLIPKYYHPPAGRRFVLDGPARNTFPIYWEGGERGELTDPMYRNHCLESDLSIVFWCNVFRRRDIHVITADGDVLLGLLLYTRYRIARIVASAVHAGRTVDFTFLNSIYLEQASVSLGENVDELVTDDYVRACERGNENEVNGVYRDGEPSENKRAYLRALAHRMREQQGSFDSMMTMPPGGGGGAAGSATGRRGGDDDDDDFLGEPPPAAKKARGEPPERGDDGHGASWKHQIAEASRKDGVLAYRQLLQAAERGDSGGGGGAAANNNNKRKARDSMTTMQREAALSNAEKTERFDVYYREDGVKAFKMYEVVSINHFFQQVYDDLLVAHDKRLAPRAHDRFLPIESFVAACKIAGDDYVRKPAGIGERFIMQSFFDCLNSNGNLVYGKRVDTTRYANYAPDAKGAPPSISQKRMKVRAAVGAERRSRRSRHHRQSAALDGDGDGSDDAAATAAAAVLAACDATDDDDGGENSGGDGDNGDDDIRVDARLQDELMCDYSHYLQFVIDHEAVFQLLRNALVMKGKRASHSLPEETRVMCANLRYSLNYFANGFKSATTYTNCFDVHAEPDGCGRSVYGYALPNPDEYPSQANICRPQHICDCHVADIRRHIDERAAASEAPS